MFDNSRIVFGIACAGILELTYGIFFEWHFGGTHMPLIIGGVFAFSVAILSGMYFKRKSIIIFLVFISWGIGMFVGMLIPQSDSCLSCHWS